LIKRLLSVELLTYYRPEGISGSIKYQEYLMARSSRREKVKLVSTANTGVYYTVNKLKGKDKLLLKKFDPKVRKHVDFKEAKLTK
jgi:large subunit ribosomal protein L33